jgi:beta-carotene hydroxylase
MLKYAADIRTLIWMFLCIPGLITVQYINPSLVPYLVVLNFYFAIAAAPIAHNHQHCPTFTTKGANDFFSYWLAIFYGFPTFGWIPTHNLNHHKFVNKPGDATITWRYTNKHNYLIAASYFFVSSYYQAPLLRDFLQRAKEKKPDQYRKYILQYVVVYGSHAAMAALAVYLHGVGTGLLVYALTMGLPALVSLWTVMTFNYDQHVHTDPWSKYNHSRNFVGPMLNFLLFNNGYHTAHHENSGLHWSKLPELHATFADQIHPDLKQRSLWWYWFKQYVLAAVFPSLGTKQIGRAPFDTQEEKLDVATAEVGFGEAGTNAARI